ncbi:MAG: hypothetical protein WCV67_06820 [Victivallaceae bacterium]
MRSNLWTAATLRRFGIGLPRKQDKTSEQPNKAAQECRTPKSGQSAGQKYERRHVSLWRID